MRKFAATILIVVAALSLQMSPLNIGEILGVRPDLLLIVLIYLSLAEGRKWGSVSGFAIGFVQDLYQAPDQLGLNALIKVLVGFFLGSLKGRIYLKGLSERWAIVFAVCFAHDLLYYLIYFSFRFPPFLSTMIRFALPGAIYSATVGSLLFILLDRLRMWRTAPT
jgi:rod shape-determining protein MreD